MDINILLSHPAFSWITFILTVSGFVGLLYKLYEIQRKKIVRDIECQSKIPHKLTVYSKTYAAAKLQNPLDYAILIGFTKNLPNLKIKNYYNIEKENEIDTTTLRKFSKHEEQLRLTLKNNENQAILLSKELNASDHEVEISIAKFSYVKSIRDCISCQKSYINYAPQVITVGGLLVCKETREIIVQYRNSLVSTHPNSYHTIGGSFQAPDKIGGNEITIYNDRLNLNFTLIREIFEETDIIINPSNISEKYFMIKQIIDGYIQYYALYINISKSDIEKASGVDEGKTVRISFDDLEEYLINKKWVPSGKMHILIWLAFGAPGTRLLEKFSGKTPQNLYNDIIENIS